MRRRVPKGFDVLSKEERIELRAKSPNKGIYYRDMARLARLKEERDKDDLPPSFSSSNP